MNTQATHTPRDMSKAQYRASLKRYGMNQTFLGYVDIGFGVTVHPANAGPRLRDRLAYLLSRQRHYEKRDAKLKLIARAQGGA